MFEWKLFWIKECSETKWTISRTKWNHLQHLLQHITIFFRQVCKEQAVTRTLYLLHLFKYKDVYLQNVLEKVDYILLCPYLFCSISTVSGPHPSLAKLYATEAPITPPPQTTTLAFLGGTVASVTKFLFLMLRFPNLTLPQIKYLVISLLVLEVLRQPLHSRNIFICDFTEDVTTILYLSVIIVNDDVVPAVSCQLLCEVIIEKRIKWVGTLRDYLVDDFLCHLSRSHQNKIKWSFGLCKYNITLVIVDNTINYMLIPLLL